MIDACFLYAERLTLADPALQSLCWSPSAIPSSTSHLPCSARYWDRGGRFRPGR